VSFFYRLSEISHQEYKVEVSARNIGLVSCDEKLGIAARPRHETSFDAMPNKD